MSAVSRSVDQQASQSAVSGIVLDGVSPVEACHPAARPKTPTTARLSVDRRLRTMKAAPNKSSS